VGREEAEQQQKIEETAVLLAETVANLRRYSPDRIEAVARANLMNLMPHLEEAIEALEDIERGRELTDRERDLQHTFKMLLVARRPPG
jgi:hypothetical protein